MNAAAETTGVRGVLKEHEMMARHTTWRVGGPADRWFEPADIDDLAGFLANLPEHEVVHWVGLGSNLLVRDGGIRGTVISTHGVLDRIDRSGAGTVRVESGVACARLAKQAARWGIGPATFFIGIPGTIGGALAMNAGAFGGETWDVVTAVETINMAGERHHRDAAEFEIGYRSVKGPDGEWFVAAHLRLESEDPTSNESIRELLAQRKETQPIGKASCGSVFRNPPGDHAARLIETAGLKGHRIGGAQVSDKHANFIINTGGASAEDVESLIEHVRATVAGHHGIELLAEVRIVGERQEAQV